MSACTRRRPRVVVPSTSGSSKKWAERRRKAVRRARTLLKVLRKEGLVAEGKNPPLVNLFDVFLSDRPNGIAWAREEERRKVSPDAMNRLARAVAHLSQDDLSDTLACVYGELGENQYAHR